jgi:hypothetical protein
MVAPLAILGSLLATSAIDVIGVYTQDFKQVFPRARPLKAVVKEDSQPMEHPLETGAITTDHRILLPVEIEISALLQADDYRNTYQIIKQIFKNGELLIVQTKVGVFENQLIVGMPHEEDPEMFDAVTIALKLKEVLFTTAQFDIVPRDQTKKSTVDRGQQQSKNASAANEEKASNAYKLGDKFFGGFSN